MSEGLFGDPRTPVLHLHLDGVSPLRLPVADGRRLWVRHEMDREHAEASAAVGAEARRTTLVTLLGIDLAMRLRAGLGLVSVADLDALVLGCRERELRSAALLKPAEAAKVVRSLCHWWEPRHLAALMRARGLEPGERPPWTEPRTQRRKKKKQKAAPAAAAPANGQLTLWG